MQNTFSQSGNDSKWFLTKIIFQNRYVALETPSRPPPFMANAILNFHFDYWHPSLIPYMCSYSEMKNRFDRIFPIASCHKHMLGKSQYSLIQGWIEWECVWKYYLQFHRWPWQLCLFLKLIQNSKIFSFICWLAKKNMIHPWYNLSDE